MLGLDRVKLRVAKQTIALRHRAVDRVDLLEERPDVLVAFSVAFFEAHELRR